MTHGSLFSGIGGFDLAAEWMGWENIFHCEWNPFGQRILNYYWPKAISYNDITKTDFTIHRGTIDVLTGGFPCQPYSVAGEQKGTEDERHLWPQMLRAVREIQPRFVVGENVSGLVSWSNGLVFEQVQIDLEAEGYEVTPFLLPAASVNAPHKRERIWFIAHSSSGGQSRRGGRRTGAERDENYSTIWSNIQCEAEGLCSKWTSTDSSCQRCKSTGKQDCLPKEIGIESPGTNRGDTTHYWTIWPTQPPVCNGDDGLPTELDGITFSKWRNESIKAGGNAIVPQVVYQIFQAIDQFEKRSL